MRDVFLLDQCLAESAVDKRLGNRHEDRQHGDQSELFRKKQTGQNNANNKLDSLLTNPLEKAPEESVEGF